MNNISTNERTNLRTCLEARLAQQKRQTNKDIATNITTLEAKINRSVSNQLHPSIFLIIKNKGNSSTITLIKWTYLVLPITVHRGGYPLEYLESLFPHKFSNIGNPNFHPINSSTNFTILSLHPNTQPTI